MSSTQSSGGHAAEDRLQVGSDELTVRVTSEQTGGALLAFDALFPAGGGPPVLHRHAPEEVVRLDSGQLAVYLEDDGGDVRRTVAGPGAVVHVPGGRAHTVRNEFDVYAFAFVLYVPGTEIEDFVRGAAALAADGAPSGEDILAIAQRHGIEIAGPVPTD